MLASLTSEDVYVLLVALAFACFVGAVFFIWRRDFAAACAAAVLGIVLFLIAD